MKGMSCSANETRFEPIEAMGTTNLGNQTLLKSPWLLRNVPLAVVMFCAK